jgi:hypothetical protein
MRQTIDEANHVVSQTSNSLPTVHLGAFHFNPLYRRYSPVFDSPLAMRTKISVEPVCRDGHFLVVSLSFWDPGGAMACLDSRVIIFLAALFLTASSTSQAISNTASSSTASTDLEL